MRHPGRWPDPATSRCSPRPFGSCQVTVTGPNSSGCGSSQWWWQVLQQETSASTAGQGQHPDLPTVLHGPKTPKPCYHTEAQPGPPSLARGTTKPSGREAALEARRGPGEGELQGQGCVGRGNTSAPQHFPGCLQPGGQQEAGRAAHTSGQRSPWGTIHPGRRGALGTDQGRLKR